MSLLIPDPTDLDDLVASLQPSFGRFDAIGRWVTPAVTTSNFSVSGAGNSWHVGSSTLNPLAYFLINATTLLLNVNLAGTALAISVATHTVTIQLPDDYRLGGVGDTSSTPSTRTYRNLCYVLNNAVSFAGMLRGNAGADAVTVSPLDGSNFVSSNDFAIGGQILLEVTRKGL